MNELIKLEYEPSKAQRRPPVFVLIALGCATISLQLISWTAMAFAKPSYRWGGIHPLYVDYLQIATAILLLCGLACTFVSLARSHWNLPALGVLVLLLLELNWLITPRFSG